MKTKRKRLNSLLLKIPKGKATTYKSLAKALNTSPRAVGAMLRSNPHPDKYPCYKVVRSDGTVGGYSKGVKAKARLLQADGIPVLKNRIQNPDKHLFLETRSSGGWI